MRHDGIRKLYYSISEVAALTDLEPHVLRYWESEFPQLKPKKNRAGNRIYTEDDIRTVLRIKQLLKEDKYTLEGARQVMDRHESEEGASEVDSDLVDLRAFLENLLQRL